MNLLCEIIQKQGNFIEPNIIKVDHLINHQIDINLMDNMAEIIFKHYKCKSISKVVTIESGGIALACFVAQKFNNVPVVYAKKENSVILDENCLVAKVHSFTKAKDYQIRIDSKFINRHDKILIVDDFLANGEASLALIDMIESQGAIVTGVSVAVAKSFMDGMSKLLQRKVDVYAVCNVLKIEDGQIFIEKEKEYDEMD